MTACGWPSCICAQICGFAVPRGWGRGILNLKSGPLPERIPLTVVVGEPLRLPPFSGERGWARCLAGH